MKKPKPEETQAGPSQNQPTIEKAQKFTRKSETTSQTLPDTGSDEDTIPAIGGEPEEIPRDQKKPAPADKKKKQRKVRLVSYSSQGDSQEDTASRRSG